jgi:hypothetical protein
MRLHSNIEINGKPYKKGDTISGWSIYPFFLLHMGIFGLSGFYMAYSSNSPEVGFLYAHGGIAIFVYCIFYLTVFGKVDVKWMFINGALGLFGIYSEIGWILGFFGSKIGDYPFYVHVIPFLYYVLYTFLLRQMILDITKARDDENKKRRVERAYIAGSTLIYVIIAIKNFV